MGDEIVYLEPDPDWMTIMGMIGRTVILAGVGCNPERAFLDVIDKESFRRWRIVFKTVEGNDETRDWSFGVESAPDPPLAEDKIG